MKDSPFFFEISEISNNLTVVPKQAWSVVPMLSCNIMMALQIHSFTLYTENSAKK